MWRVQVRTTKAWLCIEVDGVALPAGTTQRSIRRPMRTRQLETTVIVASRPVLQVIQTARIREVLLMPSRFTPS